MHPLLLLQRALPKGVDPRDAIAKLGAEAIAHGIDRDPGAKHAKWFVRSSETTGWLREEELDPEDERLRRRDQGAEVWCIARAPRQGASDPDPHTAKDVNEARNLRKVVREQDRGGALGHVQGEHALERLAHGGSSIGKETLEEIYARPNAAPIPWLPEVEEAAAT